MALVDIAVYKAEAVKVAAALEVMWNTEDLKNPNSPLRNILRQFTIDSATGNIKVDTDYIDSAYAGKFPNKGTDLNSKVQRINITV